MDQKRCTRPVNSARDPFDVVSCGLAGADGLYELFLNAGDICVEDAFGFGAEGNKGVLAEGGVVEAGFAGVDVAKLLPVEHQVIGREALRMIEEETIECAFCRVEVDLGALGGQKDPAPVVPRNDRPDLSAIAHNSSFLQISVGKSAKTNDYKLVFVWKCRLFC